MLTENESQKINNLYAALEDTRQTAHKLVYTSLLEGNNDLRAIAESIRERTESDIAKLWDLEKELNRAS
jgi:hypothetical protein